MENKKLESYDREDGIDAIERVLGRLLKEVSKDIFFITSWENEEVYIGRDYDTLRDDETGGEFKRAAENNILKLAELLGVSIDKASIKSAAHHWYS